MPPPPLLRTTTGEEEPDRLSARANLLEAALVLAAVQLALWVLVPGPVPAAGYALLGLAAAHALVGARFVHRDPPASWGLPRAFALFRRLRERGREGRRRLCALLAALGVAAVLLAHPTWPYLLQRLGVRRHFPDAYRALAGGAPAVAGAVAFGALLWLGAAAFLVRGDRPRETTRLLLLGAGLGALVVAVALGVAAATGDWSAFTGFRWLGGGRDAFFSRALFYLPWALAQQYVCLGFFNGRLRKGLGPRPGGRALAAVLTGSVFGLLHAPAWTLAAGTALLGTVYGWLFQDARYRDLFALSLGHGVAGTLTTLLLPVPTAVGPWALP